MPPRFAYWTILIDKAPTAFRAKDQADLLPTLQQLRRTNPDVVLKWFAHGRLWDSPEQERESRKPPPKSVERRGRDWRPGGQHRDPRQRTKPGKPPSHGGRRDAAAPPDSPDRPGKPGEPWRGAAGTGRSRPPGGPHAHRRWDKPQPHGADRNRPPRDARRGDAGAQHGHGQPQRRAHGGSQRPVFDDRRPPLGRDDRPPKSWPKRDHDQRPVRKPKPEGGQNRFTKPHWQARDQKGRPDQRKPWSGKPKRWPHSPSHKPTDSDVRRRESQGPAQKPPKPPDDNSGE